MCDSEHLLTGDEITAEACSSDGDGQHQNDQLQLGTCCVPVPTPLGDSLASKEPVSVASYVSMTTKLEGRDKLTKVSFALSVGLNSLQCTYKLLLLHRSCNTEHASSCGTSATLRRTTLWQTRRSCCTGPRSSVAKPSGQYLLQSCT
jgi:hypothetical protein